MHDDATPDEANQSHGEMPSSPSPSTSTPPPAPTPRRRRRKWPFVLAGIVAVPLLLFAAWVWIALHHAYSEGDRAGFIQKFSHKGWLCKTWEGELAVVNMPGTAQERFLFSVRDDSVAKEITKLMGSRVSIHYVQHTGVPTNCFGDTEYFVTGVHQVP